MRSSSSVTFGHRPFFFVLVQIASLLAHQRDVLVDKLGHILSGIVGVRVERPKRGHDVVVNYALSEKMPYQGRAGQSKFDIPSWMLSEGTRRITAILALLVHDPPPSLLCI